jgi:hypothetical protein
MIQTSRNAASGRPMPVLNNEDDHFRFEDADSHLMTALAEHTSWGYFDPGKSDYAEGLPVSSGQLGHQHPTQTAVLRQAETDYWRVSRFSQKMNSLSARHAPFSVGPVIHGPVAPAECSNPTAIPELRRTSGSGPRQPQPQVITRRIAQVLLDANIFLAGLKALVTKRDLDLLDGGVALVSESGKTSS